MTYFVQNVFILKAVIIGSALLISGCSSSSDSTSSTGSETPSVSATTIIVNDSVSNDETDQQNGSTDDSVNNGSDIDSDNTNSAGNNVDPNESGSSASHEDDTSLVTPDPLTPILTQVTFDITVPAYSSDALMVDIIWGDYYLKAGWVGDEFWSASIELPTNTENSLIVNFYDNNGGTALGTVEVPFKTGSNAAESVQLTANQFDTDQWDADADGVSNFDESIAGTNLLVDDTVQLEIRSSLDYSAIGYYSVNNYEPVVPAERPYFSHEENDSGSWTFPGGPIIPGDTTITTIDIDETGSGTYYYEYIDYAISDRTVVRHEGTRTTGENSVAWEGYRYWSNSDSGKSQTNRFDLETSLLSNSQLMLTGVISLPHTAFGGQNPETITVSLVGELIEGTDRCAPVSGTVSTVVANRLTSYDSADFTITKNSGDQYWTVNTFDDSDDEPVEEEYLVQSIGTTFLCVFADWE